MNDIDIFPLPPAFVRPQYPIAVDETEETETHRIDPETIRAWIILAAVIVLLVGLQLILQHVLASGGHAPQDIDWDNFGAQIIP